MNVEIKAPQEFQGAVVSGVNRRKGLIVGSETEGDDVVINAHVSRLGLTFTLWVSEIWRCGKAQELHQWQGDGG